ncbi:hypothetical protein FQA47_015118 [Oryzias melastigma]|uniref:Uncharacterized protein n=1 Tax=Oryzias melastigma TaxID=30732 RepID=A0A834BJK6_ORYME|nr:hypothetical protein FQA47_015118 [Oryzias melastigma]
MHGGRYHPGISGFAGTGHPPVCSCVDSSETALCMWILEESIAPMNERSFLLSFGEAADESIHTSSRQQIGNFHLKMLGSHSSLFSALFCGCMLGLIGKMKLFVEILTKLASF